MVGHECNASFCPLAFCDVDCSNKHRSTRLKRLAAGVYRYIDLSSVCLAVLPCLAGFVVGEVRTNDGCLVSTFLNIT